MLAFAARIASIFGGRRFGCGVFVTFSSVGIIICVGIVEGRWIGCVLIGPVGGLFLSIIDNSRLPGLFNGQAKTRRRRAAD